MRLSVLMPVFNDWSAASQLCQMLDKEFASLPDVEFSVFLIDDGSTEIPPPFAPWKPDKLQSMLRLRLKRNLGHQRAIAVGLSYLAAHHQQDAVLVMDSDGEDRAADAVVLVRELQRLGNNFAIFAARRKRLEGVSFRLGYAGYRILHRLLTGIPVEIGNFSVIPADYLPGLTVASELWSHYAASVVRMKLPLRTVPIDRGSRLAGKSSMNYASLVTHGLSAIAVFREVVGTRLLLVASAAFLVLVTGLAILLYIGFFTSIPLPGWTAPASALLIVLIFQCLAISFATTFTILATREQSLFVPIRDYEIFVQTLEELG